MKETIIEITNLNYKSIIQNLSMKFQKNNFITVSGPNNCGKTTLIRILSGKIPVENSISIYEKKIEEYKITELSKLMSCVIPKEINFVQNTVEEELNYTLSLDTPKEIRNKRIKQIIKDFKLTKLVTTPVDKLLDEEIIRVQLALAFINKPKILLIDDLNPYFKKKDLLEILNTIKMKSENNNITTILITSNLEDTLLSDYLYIITNNIIVEGVPFDILQKDNVLNKIGLELPFMMDLSVKLRDYDLIKEIQLDMDRMVETLWK